ncbi:hypothetical protein AB4Y43_08930 [Paraburkholderia sp. BR10872]|uniref:hypothetical protein n=1 Tax=Paraburkholderia sp. BR10872 TaxID=3236989 RepID=UPI0034D20330
MIACARAICNDLGEQLLQVAQCGRSLGEKALRGLGVAENGRERLVDFVGQRGGHVAEFRCPFPMQSPRLVLSYRRHDFGNPRVAVDDVLLNIAALRRRECISEPRFMRRHPPEPRESASQCLRCHGAVEI